MPNWVSTHLRVEGPPEQLAAFRDKAKGKPDPDTGGQEPLSFNSFIPMPESLHVEKSSVGEMGYAVFHGGSIDRYLSYGYIKQEGIQDREGLMLYLDLKEPDARRLGDTYAENLKLYGHTDWYDWSIANWGSKWDACHVDVLDESEGSLQLRFDTAWSPVEPVLEAMSQQFPELTFTATFDEESHSFYYEAAWLGGEKTEERELERDEEPEYSEEDDEE